jgi:hypothetical protein
MKKALGVLVMTFLIIGCGQTQFGEWNTEKGYLIQESGSSSLFVLPFKDEIVVFSHNVQYSDGSKYMLSIFTSSSTSYDFPIEYDSQISLIGDDASFDSIVELIESSEWLVVSVKDQHGDKLDEFTIDCLQFQEALLAVK